MQPRRSPGRVDRALAALILILLPLCAFLMGCQNANLLTPQQKAAISQNIQTGLVKTVTGLGVLAGLTGLDQPVYIYSPEMPGAAPFQAPGATVHLEGSFSGMGHGVQPGIEITRKHEGRESTSIVSVTSQGQWSADVDLAQGLNVFVARAVLGNKKGPDSNEVAVQADNAPPAGGVAQTAPAPVPSTPPPAPATAKRFCLPVNGPDWHITNGFGKPHPKSPGGPDYPFHPGVDWNLKSGPDGGQEVYSIGDGEVVRVKSLGDLGWAVLVVYPLHSKEDLAPYFLAQTIPNATLASNDCVTAMYLHLEKPPLANSSLPTPINAGDPVGRILDASSFNPHLHLELRSGRNDRTGATDGSQKAGYHNTLQSISDFGFLDPERFLEDHAR